VCSGSSGLCAVNMPESVLTRSGCLHCRRLLQDGVPLSPDVQQRLESAEKMGGKYMNLSYILLVGEIVQAVH
jgi:hypothetical protein